MAKFNYLQSNFTSGELTARLAGRTDVDKYFNGAESLKNFLPMPTGGAFRTPGTVFVREVRDSTEVARLIRFEFSATDAYTLCFNDGKIQFFRNQGVIVETADTITGITQANPGVVTANGHGYSNGDRVIISGVAGMTQVNGVTFRVAGVTANTFQLTNAQTGSNINTSSYGAYTSGGSSEKIYEIAHPYAEADLPELQFAQTADVMYITHPDWAPRKLSRTGHTAWTLATVDFLYGPFQSANETATTITPSADTGSGITLTASTAIFGASNLYIGSVWRIKNGYVKITGWTSTTVMTGDVQTGSPSLGTGPAAVTDWSEPLWSDWDGWPGSVTFFEDRVVYAGSTNFPQTVATSQSADYENMEDGADDADALVYSLASEQVNTIRWLMGQKVLLIGTVGGVFSMSSGTTTSPVTPTNVVVKPESSFGAAYVMPKRIGSFIYFVQRGGKRLRELGYSIERDSYNAVDMTILSDHITGTGDGIVDMDYQETPDGVLWCVRDDGSIATMTREVDQQVAAWSEQTTDGLYENVCCVPQGSYREVWVVVQRTIGGTAKRYVEYFAEQIYDDPVVTQLDCFYVHSGLTYSGSSTTTLTGLDHLEGKSVAILGNGLVQAQKTVSGGSITLDTAVTRAVVGLPYTSYLKTMRLEAGSAKGSAQGLIKKIQTVTTRLYESGIGVKVGSTSTQETLDLTAGVLTTDDLESPSVDGYNKDGQIYLQQANPLPCNVLALIATGTVYEG